MSINGVKHLLEVFKKANPRAVINYIALDSSALVHGYANKPILDIKNGRWYNPNVDAIGYYSYCLGSYSNFSSWNTSLTCVSLIDTLSTYKEAVKDYLNEYASSTINYVAQDSTGDVYGYANKPVKGDNGWYNSKVDENGKYCYSLGKFLISEDWKNSLMEVNVNQDLVEFIIKYKTSKRGYQVLPDASEMVTKVRAYSREDAVATLCREASSLLNVIVSSCVPSQINYRVVFNIDGNRTGITITANSLKDLVNTIDERYPNDELISIEVHS